MTQKPRKKLFLLCHMSVPLCTIGCVFGCVIVACNQDEQVVEMKGLLWGLFSQSVLVYMLQSIDWTVCVLCTLQKKLAQMPVVDMQKVQGSLWCCSNLSPRVIQPSFNAQSLCTLCTLHSDCAKKSAYANRWSLDGSLAGACCMSTAGS